MVTNLIYYLYGINVDVVRKNNNKYIFCNEKSFYIFKEIDDEDKIYRNIAYINDVLFHEIVRDKNNSIVSRYDNHLYILLRVKVSGNRNIIIDDLLNKKILFYISFNNFKWINLWKDKIDQVEYIINSNESKFSISNLSIINYYINLSEIALSYLIYNIDINQNISMSLCHERVRNNIDLYDFYDISDVVIDNYTRDIGEFIKHDIISGSFDSRRYFFINNINDIDRVLLLSRVLFPSYFYDVFDDFVLNNKDFSLFDNNFININRNEMFLKEFISILTK